MTDQPLSELRKIWAAAGLEPTALDRITIAGADPVLPSVFKVGTAASVSVGAAALAATELYRLRAGRAQDVTVEMRAAAAAFRGERYLRIGDSPPANPWSPIAGFYPTGDGRWVQLHTNFPHHRDGVLALLGCADDRDAVAQAILDWSAQTLEDALAAAGMCAAMVRTPEEWHAHPQAQAVAGLPLFEIIKLGDSAPEPAGDGTRPLGGVRALDLTRVIAGPVCGRTLAEHGAEVLRIAGPHLPSIPALVIDTGPGKRSAHLDLRQQADADRLRALARDADVFVQGYRPGAIAGLGFAPETLAELRPGIVCLSLCAYSHAGPWAARRGFDSLVQTASGIAYEGGQSFGLDGPKHLPAQALDYATGYLAAFGVMAALARRATEGGSYLVRVSLAQTGRWIDGLGRVDGTSHPDMKLDDIADLIQTDETPFGRVAHVGPAATLSDTPPHWVRPAVPLGTHPPVWEAAA